MLVVSTGGIGLAVFSASYIGIAAASFGVGYSAQQLARTSAKAAGPNSCTDKVATNVTKFKKSSTYESFYVIGFVSTVPTPGLIIGGTLACFYGGMNIAGFLDRVIERPDTALPFQGAQAASNGIALSFLTRAATLIVNNAIPLTAVAAGIAAASYGMLNTAITDEGTVVWSTSVLVADIGVGLIAGGTGYFTQCKIKSRIAQIDPTDRRNCGDKMVTTTDKLLSFRKPIIIGGGISLYARSTSRTAALISLAIVGFGQGVDYSIEVPNFRAREQQVLSLATTNPQPERPLSIRIKEYVQSQMTLKNLAYKTGSIAILTGGIVMMKIPSCKCDVIGVHVTAAWATYQGTPLLTADPVRPPSPEAPTRIGSLLTTVRSGIKYHLKHPQLMATTWLYLQKTAFSPLISMTNDQYFQIWQVGDPLKGISYGSYRYLSDHDDDGSYRQSGTRNDIITTLVIGAAATTRNGME